VRADGVSESYLSGKAIELRMDTYFFEEEWGWEEGVSNFQMNKFQHSKKWKNRLTAFTEG